MLSTFKVEVYYIIMYYSSYTSQRQIILFIVDPVQLIVISYNLIYLDASLSALNNSGQPRKP